MNVKGFNKNDWLPSHPLTASGEEAINEICQPGAGQSVVHFVSVLHTYSRLLFLSSSVRLAGPPPTDLAFLLIQYIHTLSVCLPLVAVAAVGKGHMNTTNINLVKYVSGKGT